jgi:hypothetical protein
VKILVNERDLGLLQISIILPIKKSALPAFIGLTNLIQWPYNFIPKHCGYLWSSFVLTTIESCQKSLA